MSAPGAVPAQATDREVLACDHPVTTQCVCPHRAPCQLPGAPQPQVPTPLPAPPCPPKVSGHVILNHVTYTQLFSILHTLIGLHATPVPPCTGQQGGPLLLSLSPTKKIFLRGGRSGVMRDICFQLELPFLAILFPSMENIFCSVFGGGFI